MRRLSGTQGMWRPDGLNLQIAWMVMLDGDHVACMYQNVCRARVHAAGRGQGVWHPDSLSLEVAWMGSGCTADAYKGLTSSPSFNPFMPIPEHLVSRTFTEPLPPSGATLQWWGALQWYGLVCSTRAASAPQRSRTAVASLLQW